jgi:hypothetical protein
MACGGGNHVGVESNSVRCIDATTPRLRAPTAKRKRPRSGDDGIEREVVIAHADPRGSAMPFTGRDCSRRNSASTLRAWLSRLRG